MPRLKIENFKCFQNADIKFGDLTVLVGANGVGKSSVVQSLLLLHEAVISPKGCPCLPLNNFRNQYLGSASDIIYNNDTSLDIKLSWVVSSPQKSSRVTLRRPDKDTMYDVEKVRCTKGDNELTRPDFHFLCSDRLGSSVCQPMHSSDYLNIGDRGEYVAQILANPYSYKVQSSRMHGSQTSAFLLDQVNLYIKDLFPDVEIRAKSEDTMQVGQVMIRNSVHSEFGLSTNVGFGISYLLPIIVAGLMADANAMLIVENPEAHLHPSAQYQIGKFLAMVAATGTRVVVETHSDHLINGLRNYALLHSDFLPKVIINNFSIHHQSQSNKGLVKIDCIKLNLDGDYSQWPDGFMDQNKKDLFELYKLRRNLNNSDSNEA